MANARITTLSIAVLILALTSYALADLNLSEPLPEVTQLVDAPLQESSTPNVDAVAYIGVGYNIFAGQPMPFLSSATSFLDPGFRQPIFNAPEPGERVPDYVHIRSADASVSAAAMTDVKTEQSYVSAQSTELGMSVKSAPVGALTASTGFASSSKTSLTEQKIVVSMISTVSVYEAAINAATTTSGQFTKQFVNLIKSLPSKYDDTTAPYYAEVFRHFGTHVVSGLNLGGRWTFESVFTSRSYSKMTSDSSKFQAGISAAFKAVKATGDVSSARSDESSQAFAKSTSKMTLYTQGGPPVATFDAWKTAMGNNDRLVPIKCALMPLDTLVAMIYKFKIPLDHVTFTADEWERKINSLNAAIKDGCRLTDGCNPNPSDVAPTLPPSKPKEGPICSSKATRSVSAYFQIADDAPYTSCTSSNASMAWGKITRQCSGGPDCNILAESKGVMTGTEGSITITCTDDAKVTTKSFVYRWDNPYGSSTNTFSVSDPSVTQSGTTSGKNVCLTYTIN